MYIRVIIRGQLPIKFTMSRLIARMEVMILLNGQMIIFTTTLGSNIAIDGTDQALSDGISIKFNATSGHTVGDKWTEQPTLQRRYGSIFKPQHGNERRGLYACRLVL